MAFDIDPTQAEATRRRTFDMVASDRLLFAGMHVHFPGFARLGRRGDGYVLMQEACTSSRLTRSIPWPEPEVTSTSSSVHRMPRYRPSLSARKRRDVPIFEDECYADLLWSHDDAPPSLYALDPAAAIHIGSFSKSLAPALRVGYAVASWPVLSRMLACKNDGGTPGIEQMVIAEYFSQHFAAHIARLSATLRGKLETMVEAVERGFGTAAERTLPA